MLKQEWEYLINCSLKEIDMDNQQNDNQDESLPQNKAELLERIQRSRSALEGTLSALSEDQLRQAGPSGWSIKDHLAHLATWELGIVELLRHRPRFAAMQIEEAISQGKSEEEINDLITGATPRCHFLKL